ncbi:MAG: hypothetical protein JWN03_8445 [Nocardia sp.]|nr:hypothetical protein [Nocardia sp.]
MYLAWDGLHVRTHPGNRSFVRDSFSRLATPVSVFGRVGEDTPSVEIRRWGRYDVELPGVAHLGGAGSRSLGEPCGDGRIRDL